MENQKLILRLYKEDKITLEEALLLLNGSVIYNQYPQIYPYTGTVVGTGGVGVTTTNCNSIATC